MTRVPEAVTAGPDQHAVNAGLRRLAATAQVLGTTVAIQAIGLLTGALVAHLLGVDARGRLAAIVLWASVIGYVGDLGLPLAYVFETARDRTQIPALLGNAFLIMAVQWLGLFAVGSVVVLLMLRPLGAMVAITGEFYLFLLLPMHFSRYLAAICQGERDYRRFNAIRLSLPIAYLLALVACAATGRDTIRWILGCSLCSLVVGLILSVWLVLPRYGRMLGRPRLSGAVLHRTLRYGLKAHIGNLTPVDSLQIDLMLVVALLGAHDAGLYTVATSAAMVVRVQGTALGVVTLAEVAATANLDEQRRRISALTRLSATFSFACATVLALLARPLLILVYGQPYAEAASILRILALGIAAASARQVLGDALRAAGRPSIPTLAEVASWPVGAIVLLALVPSFGVEGAAWGVSAAYVTALAVNIILARDLGLTPRNLLVPNRDDVLMARAVAGRVVRRLRPL
ncbi:MAG: oligosaccharide flippase family protein [Dehalococcoidia bacterium]